MMGSVTVTPQEFSLVAFDAGRIRDVVVELASRLGFDADLTIEVDETTPLARSRVAGPVPLVFRVDGGAFEDPKRPRQLSDEAVIDVMGRLLLRERDRRDEDFGAPEGDEPPLTHSVAWNVYAVGRMSRLGYSTQRQRWLYHFRNRCGFSDAADGAFAEIWGADRMTWSRLCELADGAAAVRTARV